MLVSAIKACLMVFARTELVRTNMAVDKCENLACRMCNTYIEKENTVQTKNAKSNYFHTSRARPSSFKILIITVEPLIADTPFKRTPLFNGHQTQVPIVSFIKY